MKRSKFSGKNVIGLPVDGGSQPDTESHLLLATVALDGNVKFLNSAWEAVLGRSLDGVTQRPLREMFPHEREVAKVLVGLLLDKATTSPVEAPLRTAAGDVKRILWHRRYDPDGARMYIVGEAMEGGGISAGSRKSADGRTPA